MKAKTKTKTQLKEKADKLFSIYIRKLWANDEGKAQCYTCLKIDHWKKLQNGHYHSRRHSSTRYDEDNCRVQCLTDDSNILLLDGNYKAINNISVGDKLNAFNEHSFESERATVLNVESFIPATLYEVELENGDKFYATSDHKVVANGGWVSIEKMLHGCVEWCILDM